MPRTALTLYLAFVVVAFGWRTWRHYRRTGDHGFRGVSGTPFSLEWTGGILLTLGMILGGLAPVADILRAVEPLAPLGRAPAVAGLVLGLLGFALTIAAQAQMRASWRIGVDEREKTELVLGGPFALVRNPIFTGMLLTLAGVALLVPNAVGVVAFATALAGLEIQVRRIEEPYLIRVHGESYRAYARTVGRFLPGLGRLG